MKNKFIKAVFISILCLVIFAGCSVLPTPDSTPDATPTPATPSTTPMDTLKVLEFSMFWNAGYPHSRDYPMYQKYLLEEWGLKCTETFYFFNGDMVMEDTFPEDIGRLFASNNTPDLVVDWRFAIAEEYDVYKEIGDSGKLVDLLPYIEAGKLDNYVNNIWGDGLLFWDFAKEVLSSRKTEKLYILPMKDCNIVSYTWLYNKHYFETELNMEAPPTDLKEVIQIMKTFAAENKGSSAFLYNWGPNVSDTWGEWGYFEREPIFNACGIACTTTWRTQNGVLEYAPMEKGYLEAISAYRDLMNTGTMFAYNTLNFDSGKSIYSSDKEAVQNNGAILSWNDYAGLANINSWAKEANPDYEWVIVPEDPSYEGLGPVTYNGIPFGWSGKVIGTTASKELVERLISFIDWTATPEGEISFRFGKEGISYELVDGKVKFIKYYDNTYTPEIPSNMRTDMVYYYRFGLEHKNNFDFISEYTIYDEPRYQYQDDINEKGMGMIEKGQCNFLGVWGNKDAAAQAIGKTAEEMNEIEKNINAIVKEWYNDFYAGKVDEDSYAQMQRDVLNAGYMSALAYREHLLTATISGTKTVG